MDTVRRAAVAPPSNRAAIRLLTTRHGNGRVVKDRGKEGSATDVNVSALEHDHVLIGDEEVEIRLVSSPYRGRRALRDLGVAARQPAAKSDGGGHRSIAESRQPARTVCLRAEFDEQRDRDCGGDERSRSDHSAQFLDHDEELEQTEALAAVFLGHMEAQPAQGRGLVPIGRTAFETVRRVPPASQREPRWHSSTDRAIRLSSCCSSVMARRNASPPRLGGGLHRWEPSEDGARFLQRQDLVPIVAELQEELLGVLSVVRSSAQLGGRLVELHRIRDEAERRCRCRRPVRACTRLLRSEDPCGPPARYAPDPRRLRWN